MCQVVYPGLVWIQHGGTDSTYTRDTLGGEKSNTEFHIGLFEILE